MKLTVRQGKTNAVVKIIPIYEGVLDKKTSCGGLSTAIKLKNCGKFKESFGEMYTLIKEVEEGFVYRIFLGLGRKEELTPEKIRRATSKAMKEAMRLNETIVHMKVIDSPNVCFYDGIKAMFEGAALTNYKFDKYKTSNKETKKFIEHFEIFKISEDNFKIAKNALKEAQDIIEGNIIARNLVNEPANVIYPETLAEKAKEIGIKAGFDVKVFNKEEIEKLNMKAYLEVAKGSDKEPKLIVMKYEGNKEDEKNILGLVGKGLTYDSGGYSIKPTDGMKTMKSDMGGAAAVIGAMYTIAKQKLKVNVTAVVASCENMISGGAYKPGDIIGSMAGKTIEVLNTDAEGRLTLVDAVNYIIEKEKVSKVVDMATLTGAVLVALGTTASGVVTNNKDFYAKLEIASNNSGEKVWQLPAFDEYKELIKSDIADLKNIGGKYAGTITAGLFIGEFVQEKPWLHIDIAGTSWINADKNYLTKGGTGEGARLLYYLAKEEQ
jgi:leucyl aminopeptidase